MVKRDAQAEAHIDAYEAARRDMLTLWTAKQRLSHAAQSRFPKSHPLFKTLFGLCHNDATCQVRHLCDEAICRCADRCGDDVFRNHEIDGVHILAVTHWFYGISDLNPREKKIALDRTKQITASDVELFEEVYRLGRNFIECASTLPFLTAKECAKESKRFEQAFATAREKVKTPLPLDSEDAS